ncbi:MAG: hypothetical protein KDK65_00985, partial [Chlamydiia bacterium]|nr:hypothetical protein [Chlamydiia bacterium]
MMTTTWGRAWQSDWLTALGSFLIMVLTPLMVVYFYTACDHFGGSLLGGFAFDPFQWEAVGIYALWFGLQILLYMGVPDQLHKWLGSYRGGWQEGSVTPAGHVLRYQINGVQAWVVSHVLFVLGAFVFEWFSPTILFDHWGSLLVVANVVGYAVAFFAYWKANRFPTHADDCKYSGSAIYDFYMGIEHNPWIGNFDFKLFFNGRPGIVAWTLINLSFAAKQYALYGMVTNSMILVNVLQAIYVLHFFWYEAW